MSRERTAGVLLLDVLSPPEHGIRRKIMSVAHLKPIVATHKKDIEWIISLWLAIHGGDPAPEVSAQRAEVAATEVIRGLAARLPAARARAVEAALNA
jgi:hypothetical protein